MAYRSSTLRGFPEPAVLLSASQLRRGIQRIARDISADYRGEDVVVVALLNGSLIFLADLIRRLDFPLRLDFLGTSSYRGTQAGQVRFTRELKLDIRRRHVLVVDDILDTGRTLGAVMKKMEQMRPASVRTCVLLDKPQGRQVQIKVDYVGFTIENQFVVGYGLDYNEHYRNLPFVGVLPERLSRGGPRPRHARKR